MHATHPPRSARDPAPEDAGERANRDAARSSRSGATGRSSTQQALAALAHRSDQVQRLRRSAIIANNTASTAAPVQAKWKRKGSTYQNDETDTQYDPATFTLTTAAGTFLQDREEAAQLMREITRDRRERNMARSVRANGGNVHDAVAGWVASEHAAAAPPMADDYFDRQPLDLHRTIADAPLEIDDDGVEASAGPSSASSTSSPTPGTMNKLLLAHAASVNDYLAPVASGKMATTLGGQVTRFNATLTRLANLPVYDQPFTVTINVGDLKGFGDIAAGAKLARELKEFYARFTQWKDVTVALYLGKLDSLKVDVDAQEIARIKKLVADLIGNSGVQPLYPAPPAKAVAGPAIATASAAPPTAVKDAGAAPRIHVTLSYPAHNAEGDAKIGQYGYSRMESADSFGSGPGFGALGVLAIDPDRQEEAIRRADDPGASVNLSIVEGLSRAYQVRHTHFAYFSIYKAAPLAFAKQVCGTLEGNTALVFVNAHGLGAIATSIKATHPGKVGKVVKAVVGKKGEFTVETAEAEKAKSAQATVLLVNFTSGIDNVDMLSMYYKSDGVVGATGDQSFMEAYAMRRAKNRVAPRRGEADILYDVAEQQRELYRHLGELATGTYSPALPGLGLKPINIDENISHALDSKLLKYPVMMLVNELLQQKDDGDRP